MRRHVAIGITIAVLFLGGLSWWMSQQRFAPGVEIPARFASVLPPTCQQVVLVLSPNAGSVPAAMWLLERDSSDHPWRTVRGSIQVTLGRSGLAWGEGEHDSAAVPPDFRVKQEGDGCSPTGVFRIPFAFGYSVNAEPGSRLPYVQVTETMVGVDDANSRYYNQVIDASTVEKDWVSRETMLRPDGLYEWGAFIAHNPRNEPGRGSCIFFHLWSGPGKPTAGCTAMAKDDLRYLLKWLDPAREPRLIQAVEGW